MNLFASTIDVVIPVYNGEKYLEATLRSVDMQTLAPSSIIVINDGSTDKTAQLLEAYSKDRDERLPVLRIINKNNGGLSSARNAGIRHSASEFIAFLDADDVWKPDKLMRQMELFKNTPDPALGVVYCDYDLIDPAGRALPGFSGFRLDPTVRGGVFSRLLYGNLIASSGSGVLCRHSCFKLAGFFDETLDASEDWDMWLRIARHFHFDFVPSVLVSIRRHSENMSGNLAHVFRTDIRVLLKQHDEGVADELLKRILFGKLVRNCPGPGLSVLKSVLSPSGEVARRFFRYSIERAVILGLWCVFRIPGRLRKELRKIRSVLTKRGLS